MTKEEMKNRISLALKDPILQIGFECICKENTDLKIYNEKLLDGDIEKHNKIAELKAQIEKMKCCGNCAKNGHICVAEEMQGELCGKNKDKWELRRVNKWQ